MMEFKRLCLNGHNYTLSNYGDGWDVYYRYGNKVECLEEGCSTYQEAYNIAVEHSTKEV